MNRAAMNSAELPAAPAPSALTMNNTAASIITLRRPMTSANLPARNAPAAQPSRIAPTFRPVPSLLRLNARSRPSCVPLITPLS